MKNRKMTVFLSALFCALLLVGCGGPAQGGSESERISVEDAKKIALNHSGVASANVNFVRAEFELDDNSYEIEFYADQVEYDYEIDASTGDIRSYDSEIEGFVIGGDPAQNTEGAEIGEEEAKNIALNHAGLSESEVSRLKVHRDFDDGVLKYEVEFRDGFTEYDYEIHAETGEIISFDIDKN